jgi:site-specific recombinase XerD
LTIIKYFSWAPRYGRPAKAALKCSPKPYIPIIDHALEDRIQSFLYVAHLRKTERIFPMCRLTVSRHIDGLVERVGGAPFDISAHTFRSSFAIHLLLHGRPLSCVAELLGLKSVESTEIYSNVLTFDAEHVFEGIDFH